jgi:hypothetical protein
MAALAYAQPPPRMWAAGKVVDQFRGTCVVSAPQAVPLCVQIMHTVGGRAAGLSGSFCRGAGTVVAIGDDDIEQIVTLLM